MGFFFAPFLEFHNRLKVSWSHQYELHSTRLGNLHKFTMHMVHATTHNCSLLLLTSIFCTSRSAHPFSTYATFATTQTRLVDAYPYLATHSIICWHSQRPSSIFDNPTLSYRRLCMLFSIAHRIEGHMSHVLPKPLSIPIDIPIKNNLATHA